MARRTHARIRQMPGTIQSERQLPGRRIGTLHIALGKRTHLRTIGSWRIDVTIVLATLPVREIPHSWLRNGVTAYAASTGITWERLPGRRSGNSIGVIF